MEEEWKKQIAKLETINDQLHAEFQSLDKLLRTLGFENGIATLKRAAKEMINEKKEKP